MSSTETSLPARRMELKLNAVLGGTNAASCAIGVRGGGCVKKPRTKLNTSEFFMYGEHLLRIFFESFLEDVCLLLKRNVAVLKPIFRPAHHILADECIHAEVFILHDVDRLVKEKTRES